MKAFLHQVKFYRYPFRINIRLISIFFLIVNFSLSFLKSRELYKSISKQNLTIMNKEVIFNDEKLLLEYSDEEKILYQTWKGLTLNETFTNLLDETFKVIVEKQPDGILLDAREHKGLGPANHALVAEKLEEYAKNHGVIKQAFLLPEDIFSKVSVENFSKRMEAEETHVVTGIFKSFDEAVNWLKN